MCRLKEVQVPIGKTLVRRTVGLSRGATRREARAADAETALRWRRRRFKFSEACSTLTLTSARCASACLSDCVDQPSMPTAKLWLQAITTGCGGKSEIMTRPAKEPLGPKACRVTVSQLLQLIGLC